MENNNSLKIMGAVVFGALVLTAASFILNKEFTGPKVNLDAFAQCLADKSVTMYGTEWCSHCKNQKKLFGSSFQYINYVDCDKNQQECSSAGVQGYPTWKINGQNYPGEQRRKSI